MARCTRTSTLASPRSTGHRHHTGAPPWAFCSLPSSSRCSPAPSCCRHRRPLLLAARSEPAPGLAAWFVAQINARRAAAGRLRLPVSPALSAVAGGWATHLARTNVLAHNPNLASAVRGWHYLGENVGVGYSAGRLEGAFWGVAAAPVEHARSPLHPDRCRRRGCRRQALGGRGLQPAVRLGAHAAGRESARHRGARARNPRCPPADPASGVCSGGAQADRLFQARRNLRFGVNWVVVRQRQLGLGCPVRPAAG